MPKHGNLSVILVIQGLISIGMADMKATYSRPTSFLTGARLGLHALGYPKLQQTFTFRHYICLLWNIHV